MGQSPPDTYAPFIKGLESIVSQQNLQTSMALYGRLLQSSSKNLSGKDMRPIYWIRDKLQAQLFLQEIASIFRVPTENSCSFDKKYAGLMQKMKEISTYAQQKEILSGMLNKVDFREMSGIPNLKNKVEALARIVEFCQVLLKNLSDPKMDPHYLNKFQLQVRTTTHKINKYAGILIKNKQTNGKIKERQEQTIRQINSKYPDMKLHPSCQFGTLFKKIEMSFEKYLAQKSNEITFIKCYINNLYNSTKSFCDHYLDNCTDGELKNRLKMLKERLFTVERRNLNNGFTHQSHADHNELLCQKIEDLQHQIQILERTLEDARLANQTLRRQMQQTKLSEAKLIQNLQQIKQRYNDRLSQQLNRARQTIKRLQSEMILQKKQERTMIGFTDNLANKDQNLQNQVGGRQSTGIQMEFNELQHQIQNSQTQINGKIRQLQQELLKENSSCSKIIKQARGISARLLIQKNEAIKQRQELLLQHRVLSQQYNELKKASSEKIQVLEKNEKKKKQINDDLVQENKRLKLVVETLQEESLRLQVQNQKKYRQLQESQERQLLSLKGKMQNQEQQSKFQNDQLQIQLFCLQRQLQKLNQKQQIPCFYIRDRSFILDQANQINNQEQSLNLSEATELQRINELNSSLQEQNQKYRQLIDSLKQKITALEENHSELQAKATTTAQELTLLNEQLTRLRQKEALQNKKIEHNELLKTKRVEKISEDLQKEKQELENRRNDAIAEKKRIEEERDKQSEKIAAITEQKKRLQEENRNLKIEIQNLKREKEDSLKLLSEGQAQKRRQQDIFASEKSRLQEAEAMAKRANQELITQKNELRKQLDELQSQTNQLVSQLQEQIFKEKEKTRATKESLVKKAKDISVILQTQKNEQVQALKIEHQQLQQRYDQLQASTAKELQQLKELIKAKESRLQEAEEEAQRANNELITQNNELKRQLDALSVEMESLRSQKIQQVSQLQEQISKEREKARLTKESLVKKAKDISGILQTQKNEAIEQVQALKIEHQQLQQRYDQLQASTTKELQQLKELTREKEKCQGDLRAQLKKMDTAIQQLKKSQADLRAQAKKKETETLLLKKSEGELKKSQTDLKVQGKKKNDKETEIAALSVNIKEHQSKLQKGAAEIQKLVLYNKELQFMAKKKTDELQQMQIQ